MAEDKPRFSVDLESMPPNTRVLPTFNKVLILREEAPEKVGLLFVPDSVRDREKPLHGVVCGLGPHVEQVKLGDTVVFGQYSGTNIKVEGLIYVVMKEEDIHVILEDRDSGEEVEGVSGEN